MSRSNGWATDRARLLDTWLQGVLNTRAYSRGEPIADASFRRYFRIKTTQTSYIVMDAPDQRQALENFIRIASELGRIDVPVPVIHAAERNQGFLLLSDLGDYSYCDVLDASNADSLYRGALEKLIRIQTRACPHGLPDYDTDFFYREMELFIDWFLARHLGIELNSADREIFEEAFTLLIDEALSQPRCFVHRDYHSRNLMFLSQADPGILDFQDAVYGPVTYDVVSLLRDVYKTWPPAKIRMWALFYFDSALEQRVFQNISDKQFLRWFDLMGVQRHLKIPGIFSRLYYRDGKPGYLKYIPAALEYLSHVTEKHPELERLHRLLEDMQLGLRTVHCTREVAQ